MNEESELIKRLETFGLTEKEAQLYLRRLMEGPRQPAELKRPLERFRAQALRRALDERSH